jgi:hypothetical protein
MVVQALHLQYQELFTHFQVAVVVRLSAEPTVVMAVWAVVVVVVHLLELPERVVRDITQVAMELLPLAVLVG